MTIRVLLADDHAIVREGVRRLIESEAGFEVVGEAGNDADLQRLLQHTDADVLVLDVSMPGPGFLETIARLTARHPRLKILALTMHPESQYAARALRGGASGYLTKDHAGEELIEALRRVHAGRRYITPALAEELAERLLGDSDGPLHDGLSDREYQVLVQIGRGRGVNDIARLLSLSPKTVSTYRARVLEKMQFTSNADIIRYVLEQGL